MGACKKASRSSSREMPCGNFAAHVLAGPEIAAVNPTIAPTTNMINNSDVSVRVICNCSSVRTLGCSRSLRMKARINGNTISLAK
jgi:hypothetical protein